MSLASGKYEADPNWKKAREYLTDSQVKDAMAASVLEGRYQNLVDTGYAGYAPDPGAVWNRVAEETLTPELYRDYPEDAKYFQGYLDKKLGRYVPPVPGAELLSRWKTQWEWNPWNQPVSEKERRSKNERFKKRYRKVGE